MTPYRYTLLLLVALAGAYALVRGNPISGLALLLGASAVALVRSHARPA